MTPAAAPAATTLPRPELVGVVPEVPPLKAIKLPAVADRTLANGLRVLAARRSGVPRLEARLVVPTARNRSAVDAAKARVLAKTILSGTAARSDVDIAQELQRIGGNLDAIVDSEDLILFGSSLAGEAPAFLALLGEVLREATHPDGEVAVQRDVMAQEVTLMRSQPATLAREALLEALFGSHPYGRAIPTPDEVRTVKPAELRRLHAKRVLPEGSILVLVGDLPPERAVTLAEGALGGWERGGTKPGVAAPKPPPPGPMFLLDRPGSVQTNIRIGGPAARRSSPDYPKLALANLVFGGYFVSRLVENIRERRGYTYSPGSGVQQNRQSGYLVVQADVGTDVTAPALVEMGYELNRMLAGPIEAAELTSAKRYLSGTMSMAIQTQAGLAAYLGMLATNNLPVEYLREFPAAVEALAAADVIEASRRYLDPRNLRTVLVGDASAIRADVEAFGDVEVRPAA